MKVSKRVQASIDSHFPARSRAAVEASLAEYTGVERERVQLDILKLSAGDIEHVRSYVAAARLDYRDVIYWAEYYATDPLLKGQDPRRLVEDMLEEWGDKT